MTGTVDQTTEMSPMNSERDLQLVSVIIAAYNAGPFIGQQLASLTEQDYDGPFEVIVADNGSTDDTVEVAKSFVGSLDLHLVDASATRGGGLAKNAGAAAARGELLVFADSDDVASRSWLRHLVAAAPKFDITAGPYEYELLNSSVVRAWCEAWPPDRAPVADGCLPFALGGNLAVWREAFERTNGFREGYGYDVDLSWHAQALGFSLGFTPDAVMHYRLRSTLKGQAKQNLHWGVASCRNYRAFRTQGLPRPPQWRRALSFGKWLARGPRSLFDSRRRGYWIREIAYRSGRVVGSVRYRVLFM